MQDLLESALSKVVAGAVFERRASSNARWHGCSVFTLWRRQLPTESSYLVRMQVGHLEGAGQVPLELGWAMSVHKCQGMTLDRAEISLARAFEPGMAYVALRRASNERCICAMSWSAVCVL